MRTSHIALICEIHLHTTTIVLWLNKLIIEMLGNNLSYRILCIIVCSIKLF